jgi:YfiH family protein
MQFKILKNKNIVQGVSEVKFGSMRNPKRAVKFLKSLGYKNIELKNFVWAEQVFSNKIHVCKKEDGGKKIKGVDGLISNIPNQILAILTGDCVPVLIYDKQEKVVAALHGGRECLTKGILEKAIREMKEKFGCQSKNILVGIGPHIRVCHYWLKEKTYQKLKNTKFKKYFSRKKGKVYFDLTKLTIDRLLRLGIKRKQVEDCKICTFCYPEKFFSFRKMEENKKFYHEKNPRFASFVGFYSNLT